jgi:deoxyribodipyrimidine photo-lyase
VAATILWFRQDLRLADQPALLAAAAEGPVIPVYVLDDETPGERMRIGGAQRWWLHHSLASLAAGLERLDSRLILRRGAAEPVLRQLVAETGAARIHALRHHEPWWVKVEEALGGVLQRHDGNTLAPLRDVRTGAGQPFKVYSAFWRALQGHLPPARPLPPPDRVAAPAAWPASKRLDDWGLLPTRPNWAAAFPDEWTPGEEEARRRVEGFAGQVDAYEEQRNLPAEQGTSRLSPHLHFGEISRLRSGTPWRGAPRRRSSPRSSPGATSRKG